MICLEVNRGEERLCRAGLLPPGIWSLQVTVSDPPHDPPTLYVTGSAEAETVTWVEEKVPLGEAISFRLVEAVEASAPKSRTPVSAADDEAWARKEHAQLTWRLQQLEAEWGDKLRETP